MDNRRKVVVSAGLAGAVAMLAVTGCAKSASVVESSSAQEAGNMSRYFLSGSAELVEENVQNTDASGKADGNLYTVYSDGQFEYYFDVGTEHLRMMISEDEEASPGEADTEEILDWAKQYILDNAILDEEDCIWNVEEISDGIYDVDIHQEILGEDLVIVSFMFLGNDIYSIILNEDVLALSEISLGKEEAIKKASSAMEDTYTTAYEAYCDEAAQDVNTTAVLNTHGGGLYWYVTTSNGSYGGFVAEIDAYSGECSFISAIK